MGGFFLPPIPAAAASGLALVSDTVYSTYPAADWLVTTPMIGAAEGTVSGSFTALGPDGSGILFGFPTTGFLSLAFDLADLVPGYALADRVVYASQWEVVSGFTGNSNEVGQVVRDNSGDAMTLRNRYSGGVIRRIITNNDGVPLTNDTGVTGWNDWLIHDIRGHSVTGHYATATPDPDAPTSFYGPGPLGTRAPSNTSDPASAATRQIRFAGGADGGGAFSVRLLRTLVWRAPGEMP